MDGVGTPIIERPRPLPGHNTPNAAHNTYTLNYEEPVIRTGGKFLRNSLTVSRRRGRKCNQSSSGGAKSSKNLGMLVLA